MTREKLRKEEAISPTDVIVIPVHINSTITASVAVGFDRPYDNLRTTIGEML